MNPTDIVLKIVGALADLTVKALEDARRGDAEALAALEADHAALSEFLTAKAARKQAWRVANDARLEQLRKDQEAAGKELLPLSEEPTKLTADHYRPLVTATDPD